VNGGAFVSIRQTRNVYRVYVGPNLEARGHYEYLRRWNKHKSKWIQNKYKGIYWIQLAQESDQVQTLLSRVIKIQIL
jgi:hypothetical protein